MTEKEMKADIENKIKEVRRNIETGETELGNAYAYMYGYVSQALMFYIGKFDTELTEKKGVAK